MPPTRRSQGPASLLGHFQATKRPTSAAPAAAGKPNATKPKTRAAAAAAAAATKSSSPAPAANASPSRQTPQPTPPSTSSSSSSSSSSSVVEAAAGAPSSSHAVSPPLTPKASPPPPLFEATHKSPVSVRQDPDAGKLYLLISPSKARRSDGPAAGSSSSSHLPPLPMPSPRGASALRQGSPSTDRTPVRERSLESLEPPRAPKKRRLDPHDFKRLRREHEQSPLPQDRTRPSFKAMGASQDSGLSLLGMRDVEMDEQVDGESSAPGGQQETLDASLLASTSSPSSGSGSGSDDELLITPRKVRERPQGLPPPSWATPAKAAQFSDPFNATPLRPKPTMSAGIFSSLVKSSKGASKQRAKPSSSDEDNPFFDRDEVVAGEAGPSTAEASTAVAPSDIAGIVEPSYALSSALPLPPHYHSLYLLHTAIEHALVVHLATTGASTSSVQSTLTDSMGQTIIRLPNLITYAALRPLVERTAGRRLAPVELARLMYVWASGRVPSEERKSSSGLGSESAPTAPAGKERDTLAGLGFILNRQRSLDGSGRRRWDWSLGIELTVTRARREATPPMQVSFGGAIAGDDAHRGAAALPQSPSTSAVQVQISSPSKSTRSSAVFGLDTPPSTPQKRKRTPSAGPSSPSAASASGSNVGREGMSLVALWNNGIDERKAEVGRRLRVLCANEMEVWAKSASTGRSLQQARSTTPPPPTSSTMGAAGLLTPPSTRPEGRRKRYVDIAGLQRAALGEDDEEEEEEEEAAVQEDVGMGDGAWQMPVAGGILTRWPPTWNAKDARPVPCAVLPSLKDAPVAGLTLGAGAASAAKRGVPATPRRGTVAPLPATPSSSTSTVVGTPSSSSARAQTLMERIKAKEEAKRQSLEARARPSGADASSSPASSDPMAALKRRATLSRLNDVATNLHMLFVSAAGGEAATSSQGKTRSPILPLASVLASVSKSSKVTLSALEARGAIDLLGEVCPGFVEVSRVGGKEWVRMGGWGAAGAGAASAAGAGTEAEDDGLGLGLGLGGAGAGAARPAPSLAEVRRRVRLELDN